GNLDVAGLHLAGALRRQVHRLGLVVLEPHHDLLDVEDEVDDVFDHPFDRRELVLDTLELDRGDRRPGGPGKKRAAHGVAEGVAEAGLERLDDEPGTVLADLLLLDMGSLNDQHWGFLTSSRARRSAAPGRRCRSDRGWGGRGPSPAAVRGRRPAIRERAGRGCRWRAG